jgi:hypothetical protein
MVKTVHRQQTWLDDRDSLTCLIKLWRTEADLRAKAQFVASTDLRIWCSVIERQDGKNKHCYAAKW